MVKAGHWCWMCWLSRLQHVVLTMQGALHHLRLAKKTYGSQVHYGKAEDPARKHGPGTATWLKSA